MIRCERGCVSRLGTPLCIAAWRSLRSAGLGPASFKQAGMLKIDNPIERFERISQLRHPRSDYRQSQSARQLHLVYRFRHLTNDFSPGSADGKGGGVTRAFAATLAPGPMLH